jgi:hypothetical protein
MVRRRRVYHLLIEHAHDLQQLLAAHRAGMIDEPARVDRMTSWDI